MHKRNPDSAVEASDCSLQGQMSGNQYSRSGEKWDTATVSLTPFLNVHPKPMCSFIGYMPCAEKLLRRKASTQQSGAHWLSHGGRWFLTSLRPLTQNKGLLKGITCIALIPLTVRYSGWENVLASWVSGSGYSVKLRPCFDWLLFCMDAVIVFYCERGSRGGCADPRWTLVFCGSNSAGFQVSCKGNPTDVWTRGGTCSVETFARSETVMHCRDPSSHHL